MTVIIFLIILAALIFVHELGHFLAAKWSGIRVDEFALGFPPNLFKFKKGETTYALNAIPFGGYVKIFGENPDDDSISGPDQKRSFVNKPKWIQITVLLSGIFGNIIFAWLLISIGFMSGMPVPQDYATNSQIDNTKVTITSVLPNSPADKAGIQVGDSILKMQSGKDSIGQFSVTDVQNFMNVHGGQSVVITFDRSNKTETATMTPVQGTVAGRATVGITLQALGILKLPFFQALWQGAKLTGTLIAGTAIGIAQFLYQAVTGKAAFSDVAGPVGIAGLVGDATRLGFIYLTSFTAFISINLAVINLIPFPALDGGRILFVIIEKIKGSPIRPTIANTINTVGFALLILLMLAVTYHDITKLL